MTEASTTTPINDPISITTDDPISCRVTCPAREGLAGAWAAGQFWPTGNYTVLVAPSILARVDAELVNFSCKPHEWLQIEETESGRVHAASAPVPPPSDSYQQEELDLARGLELKAIKRRRDNAERDRLKNLTDENEASNRLNREEAAKIERRRKELEEARALIAEEDARIEAARQSELERRAAHGVIFQEVKP